MIISFAGDQVLAEFMDGLVQEHQRKDDLVSTLIKTMEANFESEFALRKTYV